MEKTGKIEVAVGCNSAYICENAESIFSLACYLCALYLDFGSYICSVIYVKDVYCVLCCLVDSTDLICGIDMCASLIFVCQVFDKCTH